MKPLYAILIGCALSTYSCKKNSIFGRSDKVRNPTENSAPKPGDGQQTPDPSKGPSPQEISPNDERVDTPQNIAGATLTCAYEYSPAQAGKALFGCRLQDKDGKRSPVNTVSYEYQLPSDASGVSVISRNLSNDNRYDVLFLLQGSSTPDVKAKGERMSIKAKVPKPANQTPFVFEGLLSNVLRDSTSLPEAKTSDYPSAADRMIADGAGNTTPLNLDPLPTDPIAKGAKLYGQYCQACHGAKGADPTKNIRNSSKESITASLGTTADMKDLKGILTVDEIAAIEAYLK